jgi:GDP-4-dehydro-6-deoxy-D-mannose reductase
MKGKKCLVTGCDGFIGRFLTDLLLREGLTVHGAVRKLPERSDSLRDKISLLEYDLLEKGRAAEVMAEVSPDYVFHLAAWADIPLSWQTPEKAIMTNTLGTLYLLEGIRQTGISPVIEVACSSAEYGLCRADEIPVKEDKEFRPASPYAVSKIGADMLAYLYWYSYGLKVVRVRPFHVTGPGKMPDAYSDFSRGIVAVEKGKKKALEVGNLEAVRDIVDVRDCARAMWLLALKGTPGEVYNICAGRGHKIADLLARLIALSPGEIKVVPDPARMRPADDPVLIGDSSRLRALGWEPQVPIDKTLSDILDYWRENADCHPGT